MKKQVPGNQKEKRKGPGYGVAKVKLVKVRKTLSRGGSIADGEREAPSGPSLMLAGGRAGG